MEQHNTLTLDREPTDEIERTIVNGFSQVETVDEIWVRYAPPDRPEGIAAGVWAQMQGYSICRIYLAFSVLDQAGRHKADRLEEEFQQRMHFQEMEFKIVHIPYGRIPKDVPSRIWKRAPKIWTPTEHRRNT